MELVKLTCENLESEHLCCAISNNDDIQVRSKKDWLRDRLDEGLVFLKGNVRGKCMIEYIPAEAAWAPIEADGYLYVDCLWVSGQFKGHGYSTLLMDACIADCRAQGKKGLVALSSQKKRGYLSDPKYMAHRGFVTADSAPPYFELLYLPLSDDAPKPRFRPHVQTIAPQEIPRGFTIYYTSQCPFTAKYVPMLEAVAQQHGATFQAIHLTTREQAQNAPCPFTTFSLFEDGQFITHEILSEKKFEKFLTDRGL